MTKEEREVLKVEERELQVLYDQLSGIHGFGAAFVTLSTKRSTGALIRYGDIPHPHHNREGHLPHRIFVSAHMDKDSRLESLRHEMAHAWAWIDDGRVGHGKLFMNRYQKLGGGKEIKPPPKTDRWLATHKCKNCTGHTPKSS